MDNQNHCMSIKQARLIVNAHKHNLLINSFCNNEYVCLCETTWKQQQKSIKNQEREIMRCHFEFVIPNGRIG